MPTTSAGLVHSVQLLPCWYWFSRWCSTKIKLDWFIGTAGGDVVGMTSIDTGTTRDAVVMTAMTGTSTGTARGAGAARMTAVSSGAGTSRDGPGATGVVIVDGFTGVTNSGRFIVL